jgi:crystallin alpha B
MALSNFYPHRCGNHYWDVWDWPQSIFGQHFGTDLNEFDNWLGPRGQLVAKTGASQVNNDSNKFEIKLDCSHFKPEEITVKTIGNNVVINGKHEEKLDKHGWVQREFTRRYALPEGCEVEKVVSNLSPKGILSIEAPKKPLPPLKENERVIPIAIESGEHHKAVRGKK